MINDYLKPGAEPFVHSGINYVQFFQLLASRLQPSSYFEIGTNEGRSLAAFPCDALCVDPEFKIAASPLKQRRRSFFLQMTSDDFFAQHRVRDFFPDGPDICFIDGMHRSEFVLRDFINTETACRTNSLIFLHDCLPLNERMALRVVRNDAAEDPATREWWTGDVWRILTIFKQFRPDLRVLYLDCKPTGLVGVSNLDPGSRVLRSSYHQAVDQAMSLSLGSFGLKQLWNLYPTLDTAKLTQHPEDVTALFNIR
jgi:hypothetical protein